MGSLTLAQGRMFGALYESMLFGINLILFGIVVYLQLFTKGQKITTTQQLRLAAVVIVFLMCAAHLAAVYRGLYLAFFVSSVSPNVFFLDHTQPVDLTQKAVYAVATLFADGLLINRAFVIFSGKWIVIIFPLMSLVSTIALWIVLIRAYHNSAPGTILFPDPVNHLAVAAFAMSFITNLIITIMIAVRIFLAMRRSRAIGLSTSFYRRFLAYSIESGLLYPVVLLITAGFFATGNNGLEILSGSNTQVLGIVPLLLSLQLRMNLSAYDNATAAPISGINTGQSRSATRTLQFASDRRTAETDLDVVEMGGKSRVAAVRLDQTNSGSAGSEQNSSTVGSDFKRGEGSELDV
ncbi:hypothetical protein HMN09_00417800 [Mycena chlorophos]|uniref:Uncharacterized protein n=1 Tax=Mycena chlorophos TaxID=658473 RepID=A0A8H6TG06_MYCCL|nr:hypothetical protein HMN09_00417800 [Mycena chlorophos]